MNKITIFEENIYVKKYEGDLNILNKHIEHLTLFDKGRRISNVGGYQSNDITFGFEELINDIIRGFQEIGENVRLGSFWLNVNKGNDFNNSHIHEIYGFSVVYYHKICCNSSPIIFHHLVPQINRFTYTYVPENQDIIFFQGCLPHLVQPCKNEEHTRISLAFNFLT